MLKIKSKKVQKRSERDWESSVLNPDQTPIDKNKVNCSSFPKIITT